MDIRNWSLGQIMELPDHLFGRRFIISCYVAQGAPGSAFDISEIALPEICVIWEVGWFMLLAGGAGDGLRLALGDQLPATAAQFMLLDPLIHGFGIQGPEPRLISPRNCLGPVVTNQLRLPVQAAGRRLVLQGFATTGPAYIQAWVIVSSVPKEIPDWFFGIQG